MLIIKAENLGFYDKIEGGWWFVAKAGGIRSYAANDENGNGKVEGKGKGRKAATKQEGFVAIE